MTKIAYYPSGMATIVYGASTDLTGIAALQRGADVLALRALRTPTSVVLQRRADGAALRVQRAIMGLTQEALGQRIGYSASLISCAERGEVTVTARLQRAVQAVMAHDGMPPYRRARAESLDRVVAQCCAGGDVVRQHRVFLGLTQDALAYRIGYGARYIARVERGDVAGTRVLRAMQLWCFAHRAAFV